jgi:hypothetical protein
MASNSTACVLDSRLSLDEPKRQRFRRAISKFSASILVCLNFNSACMRSIRSRNTTTQSCCASAAAGVSSVFASAPSSMAGSIPRARARARRDIRQWTSV